MEKLREEVNRYETLYESSLKTSENRFWLVVIYKPEMGICQQSMI